MDRVAALQASQPAEETTKGAVPERTLTVLKDIATALKKAAGLPADAPADQQQGALDAESGATVAAAASEASQ